VCLRYLTRNGFYQNFVEVKLGFRTWGLPWLLQLHIRYLLSNPKTHMKMRNVEHFFTKSMIELSFNWRDLLPSIHMQNFHYWNQKRHFVLHKCEGKAHSSGCALILRLTPLCYYPRGYNPQMRGGPLEQALRLNNYYTNYRHTIVSCQVSTIHFLVEWLFYFEK